MDMAKQAGTHDPLQTANSLNNLAVAMSDLLHDEALRKKLESWPNT